MCRSVARVAGAIGARATSDFTPVDRPSIAGGVLTYTCTGASLGTACSGTQTVSLTAQAWKAI